MIIFGTVRRFSGKFHSRVLALVFGIHGEKKAEQAFLSLNSPPWGCFGTAKLRIYSTKNPYRFEVLLLSLSLESTYAVPVC